MITPTSRRSLVVTLLALGAVAQGCGRNGDASLIALEPVDAGESCPAGGVRILTGTDTDGDGKLAGDEIATSEVVCEGSAGVNTVVRTTALAAGSSECPAGGTVFHAGADDGAGGGVAGDGVLQDGEIDATLAVCNDGTYGSDFDEPEGSAGSARLDARGGDATSGCAGEGGDAQIGVFGGSGAPKPVRVHRTGSVDATFSVPSGTPNLGPNSITISAHTNVERLFGNDCNGNPGDPSGLTTGDLFLLECEGSVSDVLWRWNGTTGEEVTGLHVEAGATLTLPVTGDTSTRLELETDLVVEGTLTVGLRGAARALDLSGQRLWVGADGVVDVSGADGGLHASFTQIYIEGELDGDQSAPGGDGSDITLDANSGVWVTGDIHADGQSGAVGGDGGDLTVRTGSGPAALSGTLRSNGGGSTGGYGGNGGLIELSSGFGPVRHSGQIEARGGSASCDGCVAGGRGGDDGASVRLTSRGDRVLSSGTIDISGGAGTGPADGGSAGYIQFATADAEGVPAGDILVSGSLVLDGGSAQAGAGGNGGGVQAGSISSMGASTVAFFGFEAIDLSGGSSTGGCSGGDGGEAWIAAGCSPLAMPNSGVVVSTAVVATGGSAVNGHGGEGGMFTASACSNANPLGMTGNTRAFIRGPVTLAGGASTEEEGGYGGQFMVSAWDGVSITGDIDVSGADGAEGGDAGAIRASAFATDLVFEGTHDLSGGDATSTDVVWAGDGGAIDLEAHHATFTATCDLTGGDVPTGGGEGANGGEVSVTSYGDPTDFSGQCDVSGGAGDTAGEDGRVFVDDIAQ